MITFLKVMLVNSIDAYKKKNKGVNKINKKKNR